MKKLFWLLLVVVAFTCEAAAQEERKGWFYLFGAGGTGVGDDPRALLQFGGGGERLFLEGLGAGAELNYTQSAGRTGGDFGVAALNLGYHFGGREASQKLVPFVTGGALLGFNSATGVGGGNFGGGVQYWMRRGLAIRLEYRAHVFPSDVPYLHLFRAGLSFR